MSKYKDSAAFPVSGAISGGNAYGLSKREYAAIQILSGMKLFHEAGSEYVTETACKAAAKMSVLYADALFAEFEMEKA